MRRYRWQIAIANPAASVVSRGPHPSRGVYSGRGGRREEGSGDSEQDVVGSAGMLVEPTRLKQHVICGTSSALSA